jgi:hypothetical protein
MTGRTSTRHSTVGHPTGRMNCMAVCGGGGHGGQAGGGDARARGGEGARAAASRYQLAQGRSRLRAAGVAGTC